MIKPDILQFLHSLLDDAVTFEHTLGTTGTIHIHIPVTDGHPHDAGMTVDRGSLLRKWKLKNTSNV